MAKAGVEFDLSQANALFAELNARVSDMTPVMDQIGEILVNSTKQRFQEGVAPDGTSWAPNSPVTIARKGSAKPLIGKTKLLSRMIFHQSNSSGVSWGSNAIQAAVMNDGATQGAFGTSSSGGPLPWGNIPARPFIGVSAADEGAIVIALESFLSVD